MYAGKIVERGTRADVLSKAQHPYTQGLLASMPSRTLQGKRLHEIPGVVPPPAEWSPGCHFCTRCERVFEPCEETLPEPFSLSERHVVHCHYVQQKLSATTAPEPSHD
jgi:peptide/nickel transport system ATP-binding protein